MQAIRVLLLLSPTLLLFIQFIIVSNANFWDGLHETIGDRKNDQETGKAAPYDATDGYGVDIVRTRMSIVFI